MHFFSDLVSALQKVAADDVNIGAEIEALKAAEAAYEANVEAQVTAAIKAQLATIGFDPTAFSTLQSQVADLETRVGAIETDETTEDAALEAPAPSPVALSVSPSSISSAVGAAITQSLSVTGGTSPYTFDSSLADVLVDTSGNVTGTPTAAETGDIVVGDSATPSNTVSVPVTIA